MTFNPENALILEESLLRVPHETMRRTFKAAQKNLEKETEFVANTTKELDQMARRTPGVAAAAPVSAKLDEMINRMRGLKRKLSSLKLEQESHVETTQARMEYLNKLFQIDNVQSFQYEEWAKTRLDILLVDYFLRSGYVDTAEKHAKARKIDRIVDVDVLLQCNTVEQSLRHHRTAECLAWCQENKANLRKIRCPLEFEIRLQQYIELARAKKHQEAINYYRKYLAKSADTHLEIMQRASALLAFSPDTEVPPYRELYSSERWDSLSQMFVETYLSLHGLPVHSALVESLATGISALKTYSCIQDGSDVWKPKLDLSRAHMCPVCSDELNQLAHPLPYALHVRCHLDSDPVVLPNGRVYGREKLFVYSEKAGVSPDKIADPTTAEIFDRDELKPVFPT
jgi:macrophage erythroblast attacher